MLKEISEWTKEDFEAFDLQRNLVSQPTPEELLATQQLQRAQVRDYSLAILASYGITVPDTINLTEAVEILNQVDAKKYIGDDVERFLLQQVESVSSSTIAEAFYVTIAHSIPFNSLGTN